VIYEITRVCLYAGVSFSDIDFPEPAILDDYNILWRFLKSVKALERKPFPERCSETIWDLASESSNFAQGFRGVVFSGSLRFDNEASTSSSPLFRFRLEPMKLDLSHRLGRRFGHYRFFESKVSYPITLLISFVVIQSEEVVRQSGYAHLSSKHGSRAPVLPRNYENSMLIR
jgi:hypothetical protein